MSIFKSKVEKKIDKISQRLDGIMINEYVVLMSDPKKLLWRNFLSGISKGLGSAIGFTVLGAIVVIILRKLVVLNIPVIGRLIKDIVDIVSEK
ncbi:MAG: hypothetical protein IJ217_05055 [Clostridia bacterium]|nr:hypothetical protein [Clostridia bacterium]